MKAILTKVDCKFNITIHLDNGKPMLCLPFDGWLDARVAMDDLEYSDIIDSIKDYTGEAEKHGYRARVGVDV